MFSSKFINCLGKAFPNLTPALNAEMGKSQPLTPERLSSYNLDDEAQSCLSEQLTSLLEGEAWLAIENHLRSPSLERWRLLSCACDPRGAYTELLDTRAVTNPTRIKTPKGIVEGINAWEGVQMRHQLATGVPILTEHSKKYSLLNLMPVPVENRRRPCMEQEL